MYFPFSSPALARARFQRHPVHHAGSAEEAARRHREHRRTREAAVDAKDAVRDVDWAVQGLLLIGERVRQAERSGAGLHEAAALQNAACGVVRRVVVERKAKRHVGRAVAGNQTSDVLNV